MTKYCRDCTLYYIKQSPSERGKHVCELAVVENIGQAKHNQYFIEKPDFVPPNGCHYSLEVLFELKEPNET